MIHNGQWLAAVITTYIAVMGFSVFFLLWRHAREELRRARKELAKYYLSLGEDGTKRANITNPVPDETLIRCAHIGAIPNRNLKAKSRMTAIAAAKMIFNRVLPITRLCRELRCRSINKEENRKFSFCGTSLSYEVTDLSLDSRHKG